MSKIQNLDKLKKKINFKGKKIALCHGVFDLLHLGHITHLNQAKNKCDILIVSVTSDKFVNKGPNQPYFNLEERMQVLASLKIVDYVIPSYEKTSEKIIKNLKPNFYIKGPDYIDAKKDITGQLKKEKKIIKSYGGKIIFTDGKTYSSSKLLRLEGLSYSNEQKKFINKLVLKNNYLNIKKNIDLLKSKKVLILGETIIDRYIFCEAVGKSGKEPMLVFSEDIKEEYLGGSASIVKQVSSFSKKINFVTNIGEKNEYASFVKKKIGQNIKIDFIKKKNSPTIIKKRYVDRINKVKLFGVYTMNDKVLNPTQDTILRNKLIKYLKNNDLVIVSDYGHGLISNANAKLLCKNAKFLAVNCQINANNAGYHGLRKYHGVDVVLINENELRYELHEKNEKLETLIKILCKKHKIKYLVVTSGLYGALFYDSKKNKFIKIPAFGKAVIDKVGAGDAMLSLFSLGVYITGSPEIALLMGSLAASNSIKNFGNDAIIDKSTILKTISSFFN